MLTVCASILKHQSEFFITEIGWDNTSWLFFKSYDSNTVKPYKTLTQNTFIEGLAWKTGRVFNFSV